MGDNVVHYTEEQYVSAIEQANGMVSVAARMLGVTRWAIYKRAKSSPAIKRAIEMAREEMIDLAEQKLRMAILNGEAWAIALALKTIGKQRGYIERVEHTGEDGGMIKTELYLPHNNRDDNLRFELDKPKEIDDGLEDLDIIDWEIEEDSDGD